MEGPYDLYVASEKRGTVTVTGEGLYWKIVCRCDRFLGGMHELEVQAGDRQRKLGLLVPEGEFFVLRTRLPKKQLTQIHGFVLCPRHGKEDEAFHQVHPEKPFLYLCRLEHARLTKRGNEYGLVFNGKK